MKTLKLATLAAAIALISGCSTVVNGGNERLSATTTVEGGKIYVNGSFRGTDFAQWTSKRGESHSIIVKKKGCKSSAITTDYHFQFGKSIIANVFIDFGLISLPIDLISGSAWESDQSNWIVNPECDIDIEVTEIVQTVQPVL